MAVNKSSDLIASRIMQLVEEDKLMLALDGLISVAEKNELEELLNACRSIKATLTKLEMLMKAEALPMDFAKLERVRLAQSVSEYAVGLRRNKSLKVPDSLHENVNLILDPSISLSDEKRKTLLLTLQRILGVKDVQIQILQNVA
jgi:anti-sigma factor RsiW